MLPTPYYRDATTDLYLGLQQNLLPLFAPGIVDGVFTDSPYGLTALAWDKPVDWAMFWPAVYRVCKPSAIQVLFSQQPFTTDLIVSNRANYRYELIWPKTMPTGFLNANKQPLKAHENVQIFAKAPSLTTYNPQMVPCAPTRDHAKTSSTAKTTHYRNIKHKTLNNDIITERHPTSVLPQFSNGHGRGSDHETSKNLQLMMWLIATYTNPGDLVLDPFVGGGSTAEACKILGRRCIGIEMREEALEEAARRLSQEVMQVAA